MFRLVVPAVLFASAWMWSGPSGTPPRVAAAPKWTDAAPPWTDAASPRTDAAPPWTDAAPPWTDAATQWTDAARPDTLVADSIRAGQVLIRALPSRLQGRAVEAYASVRIPATGWLHQRSFFWRVPARLSGDHRFVFEARLAGGVRDTVLVDVHVTRGPR